jgi:hypothetical protein
MNSQVKQEEDPIRNYINPEVIERAPEGFTLKVMAAVQSEPVPSVKSGLFARKNLVPAISGAVVLILILLAILIPGSKNDSLLSPALDVLEKIKISLPEYDFSSLLNFNIPVSLVYVFTGILILSLLDRALNVVFHREK